MIRSFLFTGLLFFYLGSSCQRDPGEPAVPFETDPKFVTIDASIVEASGLAGSKVNPGHLWIQEDGGSSAKILLLKTDGSLVKAIAINNAVNIDWEDMGVGPGPDPATNYIYLADIGDNLKVRTDYTIYRFAEPAMTLNAVNAVDAIRFTYPDGMHDAEAILIDNPSKDIYIVTKSDNPSKLYKIPYPQSSTSVNQAVFAGDLAFGGVTGAAVSPDAKEIIIKTYPALSYFRRDAGESIEGALKKSPVNLKYQLEPQGEAVGFAADNTGFFTVSEKAFAPVVNLYFYKRK